MVLAIGAITASFYAGGPIGVLVAMAALDFPSGSQQVASDLISGGAWLFVALGFVVVGIGLLRLSQGASRREG